MTSSNKTIHVLCKLSKNHIAYCVLNAWFNLHASLTSARSSNEQERDALFNQTFKPANSYMHIVHLRDVVLHLCMKEQVYSDSSRPIYNNETRLDAPGGCGMHE